MNKIAMTSWERVKLGEVLTRTGEIIMPDAATEYSEITVKLWGKGVVERGRVSGASVNGKRYIAKAGNFIASRIDARNGAMGLVPESLDGALVTNDFPLFEANTSRLDLDYFGWLTKTKDFVELCLRASEGTTNRVRLKEDRFLSLEIPLPPLAEQRRIVARIEELAGQIHEAKRLRKEAAEEAACLVASRLLQIFDCAVKEDKSQRRIGEVCTIQGGSQPDKSQFVYEPREGYVRLVQIRDYKSSNFLTFVPVHTVRSFCSEDDVMIGRYGPPIFQILQGIPGAYNVALMKATPDESQVSKKYLFWLLQEPRLFQKVEEDSQRTSGQTGIRKQLIEEHLTYLPPLPEQRRIVSELDALQSEVYTLKRVQSETQAELDALLPAILDRAFKGGL